MRVNFITGLICLLPFIGFSQGEWNNWYFGNHAGLSFNGGIPVPLLNSVCKKTSNIQKISGLLLITCLNLLLPLCCLDGYIV
jgi:hypothetical protein